jgi:hypothetical protein
MWQAISITDKCLRYCSLFIAWQERVMISHSRFHKSQQARSCDQTSMTKKRNKVSIQANHLKWPNLAVASTCGIVAQLRIIPSSAALSVCNALFVWFSKTLLLSSAIPYLESTHCQSLRLLASNNSSPTNCLYSLWLSCLASGIGTSHRQSSVCVGQHLRH